MSQPKTAAPKVRPEDDSTSPHWCEGFFFVPVPDLSDETVHSINSGRAMPAFIGVIRALVLMERKGRTDDIRADARLGRLTIGINALARAAGMQDAALGRQLKHLQRIGIVRIHDGERQPERDPATGRIVKGRGRTPPKVIVLTLDRSMMRPSKEGRQVTPRNPTQRPDETPRKAPLKGRDVRGGFRPPSKDAGSKEPASFGCRATADAGKPLEASGTAVANSGTRPADGRPDAAAPHGLTLRHQRRCQRIGDALGMTYIEVHVAGRADMKALRARVEAAGLDLDTGLPRTPAPPRGAVLEARRAIGDAVTAGTTGGADAPEDIEERRERMLRELRGPTLRPSHHGAADAQ